MKEILNAMIYTILSMLLVLLVLQERLKSFLHPKMFGYVHFLIAGLMILAIYNWYIVYTSRKKLNMANCQSVWHYLPFLFVMVIIMLNPSNLSAQVIENKMVSTIKPESKAEKDKDKVEAIDQEELRVIDTPSTTTMSSQELNLMLSESADNFVPWIERVSNNPHDYVGEKIVVNGFVYKEETFEADNLVVARLLVTCCVADSMVVGFYVESEEAPNFEKDMWIQVEGVVAYEEVYFEHLDAYQETYVIKEGVIKEISPYDQPYVYMN